MPSSTREPHNNHKSKGSALNTVHFIFEERKNEAIPNIVTPNAGRQETENRILREYI
jgi:hypothetical protein